MPTIEQTILAQQPKNPQIVQAELYAQKRTRYEAALVALRRLADATAAPSCFISYARGDTAHEKWVQRRLAADLRDAGIDVRLDVWQNADIGNSISSYIEQLPNVDFAIIIGTPSYLEKYRDEFRGYVVAAEITAINMLLRGGSALLRRVLPVLREGDSKKSLPLLAQGLVYADFRDDAHYFGSLFHLVRALYRVPAEKIAHLIDQIREPLNS